MCDKCREGEQKEGDGMSGCCWLLEPRIDAGSEFHWRRLSLTCQWKLTMPVMTAFKGYDSRYAIRDDNAVKQSVEEKGRIDRL